MKLATVKTLTPGTTVAVRNRIGETETVEIVDPAIVVFEMPPTTVWASRPTPTKGIVVNRTNPTLNYGFYATTQIGKQNPVIGLDAGHAIVPVKNIVE